MNDSQTEEITGTLKMLGNLIYDINNVTDTSQDYLWQNNKSSISLNISTQSKNDSRPFLLSLWIRVTWQLLFSLLVIVAVVGNTIVMWIILAHREMRTVTNYFLFNLSATDFIMATFNAVFNFIYMLDSHWPFGSVYCTINNFLSSVSVSCSVFTLLLMTFHRYIGIVTPLSPRMSRRKALLLTSFTWIASILLSAPMLFYSVTKTWTYQDGSYRTLCLLWWPDGVGARSHMNYLYNITFLIVTYVIPIFVLIVSYAIMCCVLWSSKGIGELTSRQQHAIRGKKRVVKMFVTLLVLFTLCWLPYHIFFVYTYHHSELLHTYYIQNLYLGFYWLAMSNSMYNPLIYYRMNGRFRMYFRTVLCCWKKLKDIPIVNRSFRWSRSSDSSNNSLKKKLTNQKSNQREEVNQNSLEAKDCQLALIINPSENPNHEKNVDFEMQSKVQSN